MSTRGELIAAGTDVEGVRAFVGADSLAYLSLESLVGATRAPAAAFCRACFDGEYPVPIPQGDEAPAKFVLETR
jgi:amidophosphoribosyltransferase